MSSGSISDDEFGDDDFGPDAWSASMDDLAFAEAVDEALSLAKAVDSQTVPAEALLSPVPQNAYHRNSDALHQGEPFDIPKGKPFDIPSCVETEQARVAFCCCCLSPDAAQDRCIRGGQHGSDAVLGEADFEPKSGPLMLGRERGSLAWGMEEREDPAWRAEAQAPVQCGN